SDRTADDPRIGVEPARPQAVRDHDDWRRAGFLVFRTEAPPFKGLNFQNGKKSDETARPAINSGSSPVARTKLSPQLHPAMASKHWLCCFQDRKSTRLNSSHRTISYAVFCLKKKKKNITNKLITTHTQYK